MAKKMRNKATADGRALGEQMARLCDEAEPKARLKVPEIQPRCASCAFRSGPHTANGSPTTQMDALKCLVEGVEFQCHEPHRKGMLCSGLAILILAQSAESPFGKVPWKFSN